MFALADVPFSACSSWASGGEPCCIITWRSRKGKQAEQEADKVGCAAMHGLRLSGSSGCADGHQIFPMVVTSDPLASHQAPLLASSPLHHRVSVSKLPAHEPAL